MLKRVAVSTCVVLALAASAFAQAKKPAASKETDKPAKTEAARPGPPVPQPVNVRIDLTITDQRGDAPAVVKTVSVITADQSWGRIRTQGEVGRVPVILNVDARPVLLRSGSARVELTFDYRPVDPAPTGAAPLDINESLAVVLDDGKPLLLSQSADPTGDRKVKVEAKMTILP